MLTYGQLVATPFKIIRECIHRKKFAPKVFNDFSIVFEEIFDPGAFLVIIKAGDKIGRRVPHAMCCKTKIHRRDGEIGRFTPHHNGDVAKLADAHGSGPCGSNTMRVQISQSPLDSLRSLAVNHSKIHNNSSR